jgi:maltose/moltooligosaccharide transporter
LYNQGANWVGILFAVYNGFAALVAFLLPVIARKTSRRVTHSLSLIAGGVGLISIIIFRTPELLIISMLGVGLAWASILAMPYAILTGSLPSRKMGTYMGIFNFFIVIPQILAASILGFFVRDLFGGESIYALVAGGISMFIAAVLVLFVNDADEKK